MHHRHCSGQYFSGEYISPQVTCDTIFLPKLVGWGRYCQTCLGRSLAGAGLVCTQNPMLNREYSDPQYMIGSRQDHELLMPRGMLAGDMPNLDRPWWKTEFPYVEKAWRKFRGPGPR